jgi:hypothetical protein
MRRGEMNTQPQCICSAFGGGRAVPITCASGGDASCIMHVPSDCLQSTNLALNRLTSAQDHNDGYAAPLMCVPAVISTGRWTVEPTLNSDAVQCLAARS